MGGVLPVTKQELLNVKGIGPYTSSAIASICFNERQAAVDGNVNRVVARLRAIELSAKDKLLQKRATSFSQSIIKHCNRPGDFNQAFMEIGATVCLPKKPKCVECPLKEHCFSFLQPDSTPERIASLYPGKTIAKTEKPEKHVYVAVVIGEDEKILATRRANDGGLLSNQWELVCVEKEDFNVPTVKDLLDKLISLGACAKCISMNSKSRTTESFGTFKHVFSHLIHHVTPFTFNFDKCEDKCLTKPKISDSCKWIPRSDLKNAGLTRSMTKVLELCGVLVKKR